MSRIREMIVDIWRVIETGHATSTQNEITMLTSQRRKLMTGRSFIFFSTLNMLRFGLVGVMDIK